MAVAPAGAPVTNALAPERTVPSCFGPALVVDAGFAADEARVGRRRVGAVRVAGPAAGDLEVVVEGAAAGDAHRGAQDGQRTRGAFHQVQHRLLVPPGLGRDHRVVGVVLDRHLEGVGEDPVDAVLVVARRARS